MNQNQSIFQLNELEGNEIRPL